MKVHDTPESSNIARLMYDGQNLNVEFRKGGKYRYANVPEEVYEEFTKAPSAGTFFRNNVQGKYPSTKL